MCKGGVRKRRRKWRRKGKGRGDACGGENRSDKRYTLLMSQRLTAHLFVATEKKGIATHAWDRDHKVNWEEARLIQTEPFYWKRRVLDALWIKSRGTTSNLDLQ